MQSKRPIKRSAKTKKAKQRERQHIRLLLLGGGFIIFAVAIALQLWLAHQPKFILTPEQTRQFTAQTINTQYHDLETRVQAIESNQVENKVQILSYAQAQEYLRPIEVNLGAQNYTQANRNLQALRSKLPDWEDALQQAIASKSAVINPATPASRAAPGQIPILMYHHTPPDFKQQLQALQARGYTAVGLDEVALSLTTHQALPGKPVVITFDDGYADQMQAFELLKQFNMSATYYIIVGGYTSNYCIGANRLYDTLHKCGDTYLDWEQIRELDKSGIITIGGHTVDHLALTSQSDRVKRFQIIEGKSQLEEEVGHPLHHFAYPYGSFDAATAQLVREAGYTTAVSTFPGLTQTADSLYSLRRTRSAYGLP